MAKSVADYQTAFQNFMEKGARYYACPTGTMLPFAGKTVPAGFLLCNGAAISRTTYARLFSVLGTTWGAGDGSTTFNLPNVNDRCLEGTTNTANVGKYLEAGLPDISGQFEGRNSGFAQGAFKVISHRDQLQAGSSYDTTRFEMKLSYGKSIYTSIDKPQVDSFQFLIIVKT